MDTLYATQSDAYRSVTKFMVITGKSEPIKTSQENQNNLDQPDSVENSSNQANNQNNALSSSQIDVVEYMVYPNPVEETIFIKGLNATRDVSFEIVNSVGQVVQVGQSTGRINVSSLIEGVYYLNIENRQVKFLKK
jgi:hypothetical protein